MAAHAAPHTLVRAPAPVRRAIAALLLFTALAAAPAAAQRPPDTTRTARADTVPAAGGQSATAGPRRVNRWEPYRLQLAPRAEDGAGRSADSMQTIRISTLALVLIGVIVLLLIAR